MNKFHTVYAPPPKAASPHGGVSLTDASALKDTDMMTILRRFNAGDNSVVNSLGVFGDFSEVGDFANVMETARRAREDFAALPASVRDRFGNDPVALVNFLSDSANDEEAVKLGLKERIVKEKTLEERIVSGVTEAVKASAAPSTSGDGNATPIT